MCVNASGSKGSLLKIIFIYVYACVSVSIYKHPSVGSFPRPEESVRFPGTAKGDWL